MTLVAGQPLDPDDISGLENDVADLQAEVARVAVRLRRAATQTLTDNSLVTISWDTEDEDTDGFWAIGTPTVITIPTGLGGTYTITFAVINAANLAAGARGYVEIAPTSSVTGQKALYRVPIEAAGDQGTVTVSLLLAAGDTFICRVLADMAASSTTTAWLTCTRVSA